MLPGYVFSRKKADKLPMMDDGIENKRTSQTTGKETTGFVPHNRRAARIRYGLRATYPTLSDDDLWSYWSRPVADFVDRSDV